MKAINSVLFFLIVYLSVMLVTSIIMAIPVLWLWNFLMPDLFKLPAITFMQAWALSLLCAFLFKSAPSTQTETK